VTSGPRLEMVVEVGWGFHGIPVGSNVLFLPPGCSFRLLGNLGAEVDDARVDSWRGRFAKRLYLVAKPSHVGGRCGWSSLPSTPTYGSYLPREGTWPICQVLSCLVTAVSGGAEASRSLIFGGELTALIPVLLNFTYGKSFLPGDAYPLVESS
jgi:hypothetical protein